MPRPALIAHVSTPTNLRKPPYPFAPDKCQHTFINTYHYGGQSISHVSATISLNAVQHSLTVQQGCFYSYNRTEIIGRSTNESHTSYLKVSNELIVNPYARSPLHVSTVRIARVGNNELK